MSKLYVLYWIHGGSIAHDLEFLNHHLDSSRKSTIILVSFMIQVNHYLHFSKVPAIFMII